MSSIPDATQWIGPAILFLLMAVVGLELTLADFRRVAAAPRAAIGGTLAQIALLPLWSYAVAVAFGLSPALGAGAILVAVAPNAGITTLLASLARANVALAVTLTALASVLCVLTLPTIAAFGVRAWLGESLAFDVPVARLFAQLVLSLLVPIAIGALIALAVPFVDLSGADELSFRDARVGLASAAAWALGSMALGFAVASALRLAPDDRFVFVIAFTTRNVAVAAIVALSGLGRLDLALWSGAHWATAYPLAAAASLARRWRSRR